MPSTRALNSMRAQLTRAQLTPAQLLAATLLSLAIPLMLLPTCPYRPCTPPPPTMPRSANSHPHIFQPNHPARNTLHPRATHTKHTSPLPAQLVPHHRAVSGVPRDTTAKSVGHAMSVPGIVGMR